jgi:hypothetical protein
MTMRFICLAAALMSASSVGQTQTVASAIDRPIFYAGLFIDGPENGTSGYVSQTGDRRGADLAGTLFVLPCGRFGASPSDAPLSASASDAWQLSGRVLELTDQETSVQLEWRRLRRDGRDQPTPEQSLHVTLQRGERQTLEEIVVPPTGSCDARKLSLDMAFVSRPELRRGRAAAPRPQPDSSPNRQPGPASSTGTATPSWAPPMVTADLWLVRSIPGRPDETLHTETHLLPISGPYGFAPFTVRAGSAPASVRVEGTLETSRSDNGERRVQFTVRRSLTAVTATRPGTDGRSAVDGSTKIAIDWPGPGEVVSFELPTLRAPDGTALPDRMSIRLSIKPTPE